MLRVQVINALKKFAPLEYADCSWDNVGLLIDSPSIESASNTVLLTIDMTEAVLNEAIALKTPLVIAYHPIIFSPLKSLSMQDSKQRVILKAIQNGISVYCPHTAFDACQNGINEWLIRGVCDSAGLPVLPNDKNQNVGFGRVSSLQKPASIESIIDRMKAFLGLEKCRVALSTTHTVNSIVQKIAVCAGSGASLYKPGSCDVYITGEMSHSNLLAACASGTTVLLFEHSNTERGFLKSVLQSLLTKECPEVDFVCSSTDMDPIKIM